MWPCIVKTFISDISLVALLHGAGEEYRTLLDRLRTLPTNAETKVLFVGELRQPFH